MRNNLQDQTSELMRQLTALRERADEAAEASKERSSASNKRERKG